MKSNSFLRKSISFFYNCFKAQFHETNNLTKTQPKLRCLTQETPYQETLAQETMPL